MSERMREQLAYMSLTSLIRAMPCGLREHIHIYFANIRLCSPENKTSLLSGPVQREGTEQLCNSSCTLLVELGGTRGNPSIPGECLYYPAPVWTAMDCV